MGDCRIQAWKRWLLAPALVVWIVGVPVIEGALDFLRGKGGRGMNE